MKKLVNIYRELEKLYSDNVITAEVKNNIEKYYLEGKGHKKSNAVLVIFSVLGGLLVGAGLILMLAHNWDNMPRWVKTIISFIPLLSAEGIGFYVLKYKFSSRSWREGIVTFLILTLGLAIALISQIYQLGGSFHDFMFVWVLLTIPLIYVFDVSFGAILYLTGITIWGTSEGFTHGYWLMLLAVIPYYLYRYNDFIHNDDQIARSFVSEIFIKTKSIIHGAYTAKEQTSLPELGLLNWGLAISITCATVIFFDKNFYYHTFFMLTPFFALMFLVGNFRSNRTLHIMANPFYIGGMIGLSVILLNFTGQSAWDKWNLFSELSISHNKSLSIIDIVPIIILMIITFIIWIWKWHKPTVPEQILVGTFPLLFLCNYFGHNAQGVGQIIFNAYALVAGLSFTLSGIRKNKLGRLNVGLMLIGILLIIRFFDSDLSFIVRGMAFIVIGAGFLTANYFIIRGRKNHE